MFVRCLTIFMLYKTYAMDPLEFAIKYSELSLHEIQSLECRIVTELVTEYANGGNLALDYGCGPGYTTKFLKSLGFIAEGMDINKHMIEKAQQLDSSGNYQVIQSGKIPRKDNYYDLIYACWVLPYVDTIESIFEIIQELARVLKRGGILIVVVGCKALYNIEMATLDTRFEENKNLYSGSVIKTLFKQNGLIVYNYYWSEEDYQEVLTKSGLKIVKVERPKARKDDGCAPVSGHETQFATILVTQKV